MVTKNVAFSVNGLKSLKRDLKKLSRVLTEETKYDIETEAALKGEQFAFINLSMVHSIGDGGKDGNIDVEVYSERPTMSGGSKFGLTGTQAAYIEFGTGLAGMLSPYPKPSVRDEYGYNYSLLDEWLYPSPYIDGEWVMSYGLPAQAVVFGAAQRMRNGVLAGIGTKHYKKALNDVFDSE